MSQELNNKMLALTGVDKLHALGYKGNGIKIAVLEGLGTAEGRDHAVTTLACARLSAPNATIEVMDNGVATWDRLIFEKWDIANVSMTSFSYEKSLEYVNNGGIVICATGNDAPSRFVSWDHVIDIGALWDDMRVANYSAQSEHLDLLSFVPWQQRTDGTWWRREGTSFSSPFASGAEACHLEHWKHIGYEYTPQSVKQYLIKHAVDILAVGKDNQSGYGYVKVGLMNTIKAQIDKNELVINGVVKPIGLKANGMPLPGARLVEGSTMVPMRAIGDAIESIIKDKTVLSYKTEWEPTTRTAIYFIDTK